MAELRHPDGRMFRRPVFPSNQAPGKTTAIENETKDHILNTCSHTQIAVNRKHFPPKDFGITHSRTKKFEGDALFDFSKISQKNVRFLARISIDKCRTLRFAFFEVRREAALTDSMSSSAIRAIEISRSRCGLFATLCSAVENGSSICEHEFGHKSQVLSESAFGECDPHCRPIAD